MVTLQGHCVAITGAGRGIGASIARACAALGARVLVNDIDGAAAAELAGAIRAAGGEAVADTWDIATWDGAGAMVAHCLAQWGRIDGLVNNAGLYRLGLPQETGESDVRALLQVNVMGTMFCTIHAVAPMRAAGRGAIVNVTSGAQVGMPAMSVYGASKGAVAAYTFGCALDLQVDGIRVNALSPLARTRMDQVNMDYYARRAITPAPIARSADDNAPAVCFLLSDAAQGITGQVVRTDGDRLSLMTHPAIAEPVVTVRGNSADAVAAAFDQTLRARLQPLGLVSVTQQRSG